MSTNNRPEGWNDECEALYQQAIKTRKRKPNPAPKPVVAKSAEELAQELWAKKPLEVKLLEATAQNEEVVDYFREVKQREAELAYKQATLDGYWQSILNAREVMEDHGCHCGPEDSDAGLHPRYGGSR
jgi:hypothetical protein